MRRPPIPRASVHLKLAFVLFGVVAGALAVVYLAVVPRLEDRLVDAKIRQLEDAAPSVVSQLRKSENTFEFRDTVEFAATNLNARIVVFDRLGDDALRVVDDSSFAAADVAGDPVALHAAETRLPSTGRVSRDERSYAEVAMPVGANFVVLLSAPLDDALANVRLVGRSVLVAGLAALLAAAAVAYLAARGLTRRLRRLETAADRIARGDFDVPIDTAGTDEVAQLARGFDAMRARLAHLDRARREFIANASHELRTPLFSLGGFLELLSDEELDAETRREFLAETRAQVDRLTRLATDLLDLTRLDAGQIVVERANVDVAAVARTVCEEFRPLADATEHPLTVVADGPAPAVGDEQRLVQIGRILVENALRHTPEGTPVEISVGREDGRVVLSVRDEGPGIPPDDQPHVFERFYRATGGHAAGSGLGLAIARELAKRMDGLLALESRPGETRFTLALPPSTDPPFSRGNGRGAETLQPHDPEPVR